MDFSPPANGLKFVPLSVILRKEKYYVQIFERTRIFYHLRISLRIRFDEFMECSRSSSFRRTGIKLLGSDRIAIAIENIFRRLSRRSSSQRQMRSKTSALEQRMGK